MYLNFYFWCQSKHDFHHELQSMYKDKIAVCGEKPEIRKHTLRVFNIGARATYKISLHFLSYIRETHPQSESENWSLFVQQCVEFLNFFLSKLLKSD